MGARTVGLCAVVMAVGLPWAARAATLDQHQDEATSTSAIIEGPTNFFGTYSEAQTFTAGISGLLQEVDLFVYQSESGSDLTVEIRNVDSSGAPGTTVLATGTLSGPVLFPGTWTSVSFEAAPRVVAGTTYAIVAYTGDSAEWDWALSSPDDPYTGGDRYSTAGSPPSGAWQVDGIYDAAFRTYVGGADLSVAMVGPTTAASRSAATYILTVSNAGPETAQNVVLSDFLPYGTQFLSVTSSQGTCTPPSKRVHAVTCSLGDMAVGGSENSAVTVKITAKPGAYLNNAATVTSDTADPDESNNTASVTTGITK